MDSESKMTETKEYNRAEIQKRTEIELIHYTQLKEKNTEGISSLN